MKRYIQKIFGLDRLYDRAYGLVYVVRILYTMLAGYFLYNLLVYATYFAPVRSWSLYIVMLFLAVLFLYYIQELVQTLAIRKRLMQRTYMFEPTDSVVHSAAIIDELGENIKIQMIEANNNSCIYDVRKEYFQHTKYGDYKSKESFYTIFEFKLKRRMPNVIFDARRAKSRQFKKLFIAAQKVRLEGDFSNYFDAYMPQYYQVDTLSFISPEVMQAMLALKDIDYEICGDSLLCYAPLLSSNDINITKSVLEKLHETLNNNLESYRDERLNYTTGKQQVTAFGSKLLLNPNQFIPGMLLSAVGIGVMIYLAIHDDPAWLRTNISLFAFVIFVSNTYLYIKRTLHNRKRLAEYTSFIQTTKYTPER